MDLYLINLNVTPVVIETCLLFIINGFHLFYRDSIAILKDRLSASDMLHVRKVIEHVYEKVLGGDNNSHTGSTTSSNDKHEQGGQGTQYHHGDDEDDVAVGSIAEAKVELLCQDQVCRGF